MQSGSSSPDKNTQSQKLLKEIRNLLVRDEGKSNISDSTISEQQVESYFEQSYQRIYNSKQLEQSGKKDPQLYYSKITAANRLIENESPMVQKYIKAKIQSELFSSQNYSFIQSSINELQYQENRELQYSEDYQHLLSMKKQLQHKYLQQRLEKQKQIDQMINKTINYKNYDNVHQQIPLLQIESLVSRQGLDYDSLQKEQSKISSENNRISSQAKKMRKIKQRTNRRLEPIQKIESQKSILYQNQFILNQEQQKDQTQQMQEGEQLSKNMQKYLHRSQQGNDNDKIQIPFYQDEESYLQQKNKNTGSNINSLLTRSPNFVQCFKGFLQQIIQNDDQLSIDNSYLQISFDVKNEKKFKEAKKRFSYPKRQKKNQALNGFIKGANSQANSNVSWLSMEYKTKGLILLPKGPSESLASRSNLFLLSQSGKIKKVISKRIGQTNKYHLKQCIINGNFLYYSDEQSSNIETGTKSSLDVLSTILELEKMKKVEINVEPLEIVIAKKQEGNIFQKKQSEIQMVAIRGIQRNFYYQNNYAEGQELTQLLISLKLKTFHRLNCTLGARANTNMEKFIFDDHGILDFSYQYLRPFGEYPKQSYRRNFLTMLMSIFPKRKDTTRLEFENCKLGLSQLEKLMDACSTHFSKIVYLNFSRTKLDSKILGQIFKLIKKCSSSTAINLNLSSCEIDDNILIANMVHLSAVVSKLSKINLSKNPELTDKSIQELAVCISSKISLVEQIDLSGTRIEQLYTIGSFLRSAQKLNLIKANNCGLRCNDLSQIKDLNFSKQIEKSGAINKNIKIQMKQNHPVKSIKQVDSLVISGLYQFQFGISSTNNTVKIQDKGFVSKNVCIQFVI